MTNISVFDNDVGMTLNEWIKHREMTFDAVAARLGVANGTVVHRYATKGVIPRAEIMLRIFAVTDGEVTPNDFYGLHPSLNDKEAAQ